MNGVKEKGWLKTVGDVDKNRIKYQTQKFSQAP